MTLQPFHSEFPYIWENFSFFLSVQQQSSKDDMLWSPRSFLVDMPFLTDLKSYICSYVQAQGISKGLPGRLANRGRLYQDIHPGRGTSSLEQKYLLQIYKKIYEIGGYHPPPSCSFFLMLLHLFAPQTNICRFLYKVHVIYMEQIRNNKRRFFKTYRVKNTHVKNTPLYY